MKILSFYRKRTLSPEDLEYYQVHEEMQLNLLYQYTEVDRIIKHSTSTDDVIIYFLNFTAFNFENNIQPKIDNVPIREHFFK